MGLVARTTRVSTATRQRLSRQHLNAQRMEGGPSRIRRRRALHGNWSRDTDQRDHVVMDAEGIDSLEMSLGTFLR